MCGVVGVLSRGGPLPHDVLDGGLAALTHRGPDARGQWRSKDGRVCLGHNRLAVIDLAGPPQPVQNEDGTVVAAINGELYGFEAQRRALQTKGHHFRSQGDSELAVHLYEEHGLEFLGALRGEFAIVLWDQRSQRLIAAIDRFGVKPLYLASDAERVFLSSEVKALPALGFGLAWDQESVADATAMQYPLPGRTLFRGVQLLPPGHLAVIARDGTVHLQRWWDLDYPQAGVHPARSTEEAVVSVRRALTDAVEVRLRSDVPVAFQLSGGIDSSAVLALAAQRSSAPLRGFTLRFFDPRYDESGIAQETAKAVGAQLEVVDAPIDGLAELLSDAVWAGEGVAINAHLPAKLALSRAVRSAGHKVILTGEGADEVFGGYAHFRMDLGADVAQTNPLQAGLMLPEGASLSTDGLSSILGWTPSFLRAKATLGFRLRSLLEDEVAASFLPRDSYQALGRALPLEQLEGRTRVEQAMVIWTKLVLPSYLMRTLGDGLEMASGLEGRLPFLDHQLFAVLRALPPELKIQGGVEKWIEREALRGVVPEAVRVRQKQPLLAPPLGSSPVFRRLLLDLADAGLPFFSAERVRAALGRWAELDTAAQIALDPALVFVATLALLGRRFQL